MRLATPNVAVSLELCLGRRAGTVVAISSGALAVTLRCAGCDDRTIARGGSFRHVMPSDLRTDNLCVLQDHLLAALLFHQTWQRCADLVEVGGRERVLELVEGLKHLTRCGNRQVIDDVLFELHRHRRVVVDGANVARHQKHLVLIDQLLRRANRALGVVARIFNQQLDLATMEPPCSLISSTRSCMPLRDCLPKAVMGPDKSWMVPTKISVLLTPCICAWLAALPNKTAAADVRAENFIS